MNNDKIVMALGKLKEIILNHGWIQGTYENVCGVCLKGGLRRLPSMCNCDIDYKDIWNDNNGLYFIIKENLPPSKHDDTDCRVVTWNDSPERTKEDVIQFLDGLINKYKK